MAPKRILVCGATGNQGTTPPTQHHPAVTKAVFDQWESKKQDLNHQYLHVTNARVTPNEIVASIKRESGKQCTYTVLPSTGVPDRDIMFELYNSQGMYGAKEIPDLKVLELGVKLHGVDDFVRERLLPHLGCLKL